MQFNWGPVLVKLTSRKFWMTAAAILACLVAAKEGVQSYSDAFWQIVAILGGYNIGNALAKSKTTTF